MATLVSPIRGAAVAMPAASRTAGRTGEERLSIVGTGDGEDERGGGGEGQGELAKITDGRALIPFCSGA